MVFKAHGSGASIYIVDMGELVVRKAQGSGRNSSIVVNVLYMENTYIVCIPGESGESSADRHVYMYYIYAYQR